MGNGNLTQDLNINSSFFNQQLYYNDLRANGTNDPCYNGNISGMDWKATSDNVQRGYDFAYDALSRLTRADYLEQHVRKANRFDTSYEYDKHGNPLRIKRYGQTGAGSYGLIDNLSISLIGNQLKSVENAATASAYNEGFKFKNGVSQPIEYSYDSNGALTKDSNKGIEEIQYNFLHLPKKVVFADGSTVSYVYDANGVKRRTTHSIGNNTTVTDYYGNAIYENGVLSKILTENGYITLTASTPTYHYYLKDHLGNNRVVIDQNGTIEQVNHYYPFGGLMATSTSGGVQPYMYNGKELDRKNGLDLYDYSARYMDGVLGRFTTMDPMAEKYYSISPYAYCANNPMRYVDLRGDSLTLAGDNIQEIIESIYNGLDDSSNVSMRFKNGVLDPASIQNQASNTSDLFLQDLYEIAINSMMVELSFSDKNTYIMNKQTVTEDFTTPTDTNSSDFGPEYEAILRSWGEPLGKSINGNLGQTLIPGNISVSGKNSTNRNIQVIINSKGTLNHRTVGLAHEFGHVILYMRGLPYGHTQPGVDNFIYERATRMSKKLGYDH